MGIVGVHLAKTRLLELITRDDFCKSYQDSRRHLLRLPPLALVRVMMACRWTRAACELTYKRWDEPDTEERITWIEAGHHSSISR